MLILCIVEDLVSNPCNEHDEFNVFHLLQGGQITQRVNSAHHTLTIARSDSRVQEFKTCQFNKCSALIKSDELLVGSCVMVEQLFNDWLVLFEYLIYSQIVHVFVSELEAVHCVIMWNDVVSHDELRRFH